VDSAELQEVLKKATQAFKHALEKDPNHLSSLYHLGLIKSDNNEYLDAIQC